MKRFELYAMNVVSIEVLCGDIRYCVNVNTCNVTYPNTVTVSNEIADKVLTQLGWR